jgi:transposase
VSGCQHISTPAQVSPEAKESRVATYELTAAHSHSKGSRKGMTFKMDALAPAEDQGRASDYARSGYDLGHMAPAEDFAWCKTLEHEKFSMANVEPQLPGLNRQGWERIEEIARVNPPDHAIVLSIDEKSQIQALDRTQPGLPMKKGRAGTMTHDYKRHGTTTLFAALNVLEGNVLGQCMKRHRHQEFIRFLNAVDANVPAKKAVHAIIDNYAAHKHPKVMEWLDRHPRFVFHFTPTSASWLNAVEGFFAKLTKQRLKRGIFRSVEQLKAAIHRFLADANQNPTPFTWTKDPNKILAAVKRGHQVLDSIH